MANITVSEQHSTCAFMDIDPKISTSLSEMRKMKDVKQRFLVNVTIGRPHAYYYSSTKGPSASAGLSVVTSLAPGSQLFSSQLWVISKPLERPFDLIQVTFCLLPTYFCLASSFASCRASFSASHSM